jgi:hypothetical protein
MIYLKKISMAAVGLLLLLEGAVSSAFAQAVLVNIDSTNSAPLVQAIQAKGLTAKTQGATEEIDPATRLIVWEAKAGGGSDVTPAQAQQISEIIRKGGSFLLTFDQGASVTPMRLAFMLPTIPWHAEGGLARSGISPAVSTLNWDTSFFPDNAPVGITLPFHYEIEPTTAAERGMERYDSIAYNIPAFDLDHKPGDYFWTRPLINRDWTIRLRGNDGPEAPLLITGRYGAGRVAVFASTATAVTAANQKMWADLVDWLTQPAPPAATSSPIDMEIASNPTVDASGNKSLAVTVHNPSDSPASGTVLVRFLTWEGSMVQDAQQSFALDPKAKATVLIPFPTPGPTSYQALDFQDAFDVRVGVLSADQTTLVAETHQKIDLDPPLTLSLQTDNLRALPYPFPHAPGQNMLGGRMGTPVMAYAYKPGQTVSATVTLANGVRNIASLANVEDETQPGNATVSALTNNSSQIGKASRGGAGASGMWVGKAGVENIVKFTFPQPVWISDIVLNGNPTNDRRNLTKNPGAVSLEVDGKPIAQVDHLDAQFVSGLGLVRISFAPVQAQVIRVHLPWVEDKIEDKEGDKVEEMSRVEPQLGGILIEGSVVNFPPPQKGTVTLTLRDSLAGKETPIAHQDVSVGSGESKVVPFSFALPSSPSTAFYQLKAAFQGQEKAVPIMAITPTKTLLPVSDVRPPNAVEFGFVVTGGFRNASAIGVGTQETTSSWASPDDLVWAFTHGLKQTGMARAASANTLFTFNGDIGHYGNPWTSYRNGEMFFTVAAPHFLETAQHKPNWKAADHVILGFGDRWDSGPSMNSMFTWQDLVAFDQFLRSQGKPGLKGQTHTELSNEVATDYNGLWQNWQMTRYVQNVETLRKTFAAEGKTVTISGQGIPLAPAGPGKIIAQTVRGMSDDNTWGMTDEDIPKTTGRQMTYMAYDPWWALGSNFVWGWNSAILNNSYWYAPVGTTEPSRRHQYDRAWRATIDGDGNYRSMFTYGYGMNGGTSYVMNQNDWQENWLALERHSLIYPDGPIGAGLIIGTSVMDNPDTALFSGGGMGDSPASHIVDMTAPIFGKLQHAGLSIPFMASAESVSQWKGHAPLIVADLSVFSDAEIGILKKLVDGGTHIAAFQGAGAISAAAQGLFGVHADGTPDGGEVVGQVHREVASSSVPIVAHGKTLFIPADANSLNTDDMRVVAPLLSSRLELPVQFPEGIAGYGFTEGKLSYIVVEDWLEQGRVVSIRLRAGPGKTPHAVNVNNHETLAVHRDKDDWVIDLPLRPGDGALIAFSESP